MVAALGDGECLCKFSLCCLATLTSPSVVPAHEHHTPFYHPSFVCGSCSLRTAVTPTPVPDRGPSQVVVIVNICRMLTVLNTTPRSLPKSVNPVFTQPKRQELLFSVSDPEIKAQRTANLAPQLQCGRARV